MNNEKILNKGGIMVADTSSIVYLTKVSLIKKYCLFKSIIVSKQIYEELICNKELLNNNDISIYNELILNNQLKVYSEVNKINIKKNNFVGKLSAADESIINLYFVYDYMDRLISKNLT